MKYAFIFPGQGAQYVGMGKDFYTSYEEARLIFEEASDLLSYDFTKLIFEGPASELTLTDKCQVAIYITSLAILSAVQKEFPSLQPIVTGGLSLGEYTALTAAKKISFQSCLPIVQARGHFMHEASLKYPGTMAVVLGLALEEIEEIIKPYAKVWVANLNCPGQIVISGKTEEIDHVTPVLKAKGAKRVLPLDVSGAFHSGLMEEARQKLEPLLLNVELMDSEIALVMNVPGALVKELTNIRHHLIRQVVSLVKWEEAVGVMEPMVDCFLEIGCGKTLQGINKRIGVTVPTFSIDKVSDFEIIAQTLEDKYASR